MAASVPISILLKSRKFYIEYQKTRNRNFDCSLTGLLGALALRSLDFIQLASNVIRSLFAD